MHVYLCVYICVHVCVYVFKYACKCVNIVYVSMHLYASYRSERGSGVCVTLRIAHKK